MVVFVPMSYVTVEICFFAFGICTEHMKAKQ